MAKDEAREEATMLSAHFTQRTSVRALGRHAPGAFRCAPSV